MCFDSISDVSIVIIGFTKCENGVILAIKKINQERLEISVCPICKQKLELKDDELVCVSCGRCYRTVNGAPHMFTDDLR